MVREMSPPAALFKQIKHFVDFLRNMADNISHIKAANNDLVLQNSTGQIVFQSIALRS